MLIHLVWFIQASSLFTPLRIDFFPNCQCLRRSELICLLLFLLSHLFWISKFASPHCFLIPPVWHPPLFVLSVPPLFLIPTFSILFIFFCTISSFPSCPYFLQISPVHAIQSCPRSCSCPGVKEVHCTFRHLAIIPKTFPKDTERLNLG